MDARTHAATKSAETRADRDRRPARAGFTLVEALVAFAILGLTTVVIQRGVAVALGGIARTETRLGAELVARTLMTGPLGMLTAEGGESVGRLGDYDWRIRLERLPLPPGPARPVGEGAANAASAAVFVPVRMLVAVSAAGTRRSLASVETVRLVRLGGS